MKTMKKVLALVLCAVLLVGASVAGTLAYLADSKTVTNTFTVGKVTITLDEAKVDEYGEPQTTGEGEAATVARVTAQEKPYKLLPDREYTKDPKITVTSGSEPCWLFVKVENGIEAYEAADTEASKSTIAAQLEANGWEELSSVDGMYYLAPTAAAGEEVPAWSVDASAAAKEVPVFGTFTISDNADTVEGWSNITADTTKVVITAYAIQADGFASASEAWTNAGSQFSNSGNTENGGEGSGS